MKAKIAVNGIKMNFKNIKEDTHFQKYVYYFLLAHNVQIAFVALFFRGSLLNSSILVTCEVVFSLYLPSIYTS